MRVKPSALTGIVAIARLPGGRLLGVGDHRPEVRRGRRHRRERPEGRHPGHRPRVPSTCSSSPPRSAGGSRPSTSPERSAAGGCGPSPRSSLVGAIANLASTKWGRIDDVGSYVFWLGLGCVFVGFSEEMLTRGIAIVGARGSMHEKWVWVFSGVIFSLLHAPNAFFGQSVGGTAFQMVFAFAVGLTYYVTRRIAGTLDRHDGAARDVGLRDLHPGSLRRSTSTVRARRWAASSSTSPSSSASSPW